MSVSSMESKCSKCGKFRNRAEVLTYGSRCEDCWVEPRSYTYYSGYTSFGGSILRRSKSEMTFDEHTCTWRKRV